MAGSKLSFDYSKWDRLELSDDEETFHPNLDTNLNVRVNRITRDRKEEEVDAEKEKLEAAGDLEKAEAVEATRPLHIGNVCHVAEERTIVNWGDGTRKDRIDRDLEEFSVDEYTMFKETHSNLLEEFLNADWENSRRLLHDKGDILLDSFANTYFMLTALDEQMKGTDEELVKKLARQGQLISQIHQLAEPMKRHPRDLVPRFFEKFENPNSRSAFQEGVDHFLGHIVKRAEVKKQEEAAAAAVAEAEEEEETEDQQQPVSLVKVMRDMSIEERKGPGGLDPVEVFDSLPENLQACFESGNVDMLKEVASDMSSQEFELHFQRCVDAGLWSRG